MSHVGAQIFGEWFERPAFHNPDNDKPPPPPVPPGQDPASISARAAAENDVRVRSQYGRQWTNPLGGLGDTSTPNLATKSLLGT